MSTIEVKNVTYIYSEGMPDAKVAVENVDLSIRDGEFIGIIGHTGSGKSTLIQMLNGLLKPSKGQVFINGSDIWKDKASLRQSRFDVGVVLQYPEYQLFAETCYDDIAFGPRNMGLDAGEIERRIYETCAYLGLSRDLLKRSPFELSGGEKRRVAIAGVLAMKPGILVLDEPTAGLDPRGRRDLLNTIHAYHENEGNTVLFVSHSMDDVARYSDRVLVLNHGTVFAFDDTRSIFSRAGELKQIGLSIPASSDLLLSLQEKGFAADPSHFTPDEAVREIRRLKETL